MNRMRLWRSKKTSQEAGRQTQVCVWTPEQDAELVRQLCTRLAEPSERGSSLRSVLMKQLNRRRTIGDTWSAGGWTVEFDRPFVGPWWFMRQIGGRIIGPLETHIELQPEEANELNLRLDKLIAREIEAWASEKKFYGTMRDDTGVILSESLTLPHEDRVIRRPASDAEFAANEARIARTIHDAAIAYRKPPFKDSSLIEFEGAFGFPSFCQIAHRQHQGRVQFALIHMPNGGSSPTNMVESLATLMRLRFYPKLDPGLIDWFDVVPPGTYDMFREIVIHAVTLQHANGVYSDPDWSGAPDDPSGDWRAFIEATIERGRKARELAQAAPHNENAVAD